MTPASTRAALTGSGLRVWSSLDPQLVAYGCGWSGGGAGDYGMPLVLGALACWRYADKRGSS